MRSLFLLALLAAPAAGQTVIDAGMQKAQVVAALGKPIVERSTGDATFLFYSNGCERTCGMHDVVVLDKDVVVDAVFRSPKRHFAGTSSSPRMIPAAEARRGRGAGPTPASAKPAPKTVKTKPLAEKPAVVAKPSPAVAKPAPVVAKPAPAVAKPAPAVAKPAPVAAKPAPVVAAPVTAAPTAAAVTPAKTAPAAAKPNVPAPKKTAPAEEKAPAAETPASIRLKTTKPPTAS